MTLGCSPASLAWRTCFSMAALIGLQGPGLCQGSEGSELRPPVRLSAGGEPIDVTVGHAAPLVMDFDGDGLRDLLVGEFGTGTFPGERLPADMGGFARDSFDLGKLRIYRNVGSAEAPRFEDFKYLRAGKEDASIPTT
ncbi:hypothetical protein CMO84_02155 [Candidatus Woesearchaeota archaeon]|nr:hypothetical protein [Candidatus Woesearchaeota archaeon]